MTKKSRQKFKYLGNEESIKDEIKKHFHHFGRAIIEANKIFFLKRESPTLSQIKCTEAANWNYHQNL